MRKEKTSRRLSSKNSFSEKRLENPIQAEALGS
jgi:hypothetical protein